MLIKKNVTNMPFVYLLMLLIARTIIFGSVAIMNRKCWLPTFAFFLALVVSGVVWARVIEFEDVIPTTVIEPIFGPLAGTTLTSGGFVFDVPGAPPNHAHLVSSPFNGHGTFPDQQFYATNGTQYIGMDSPIITMTSSSSEPFNLLSFDAAEGILIDPDFRTGGTDTSNATLVPSTAKGLDVVGTFAGGGTITASFSFDGINDSIIGQLDDFEPFALTGFVGLSSVEFRGLNETGQNTGSFSIDNISLETTSITVNTPFDLVGEDINPGDGVCSTGVEIASGPHAGKFECTLRAAIMEANATPGEDTIDFDIPGANPVTISPVSPLPAITDPVIIDGTTQKTGIPNTPPKIVLDGNTAGSANGLDIGAKSTIKGMTIINFDLNGINFTLGSSGSAVKGCFIGIDGNDVERPNKLDGIRIEDSSDNLIGGLSEMPGTPPGNVISGNGGSGVQIIGRISTLNRVEGNLIGTNKEGDGSVPNTVGVKIQDAPGNTIGGSEPGKGNVISGNNSSGVLITGSEAIFNEVLGNLIGTNKDGDDRVRNFGSGIKVDGGDDNTIGGKATPPGSPPGNVISGNSNFGVWIRSSHVNKVLGNLIGTNKLGNDRVAGNSLSGIGVEGGGDNIIGGSEQGEGNVISGNDGYGVAIEGSSFSNKVLGNFIGTNKDGDDRVRNFDGGIIVAGGGDNIIGGITTQPGSPPGNVISGNGGSGVSIGFSSRNKVLGNIIGTNRDHKRGLYNGFNFAFINRSGINIFGKNTENNIIGGHNAGNLIWTRDEVAVKVGRDWKDIKCINNAIIFNEIAVKEIDPARERRFGIDLVSKVSKKNGINITGTSTPNDKYDRDHGPNNLQNFPVLSSVQVDSEGNIEIIGQLISNPGKYLIQFYKSKCKLLGEELSYDIISQGIIEIPKRGRVNNFQFSGSPVILVEAGDFITATATLLIDYTEDNGEIDVLSGETSEFSWPCVEVTQKPE